MVRSVLAEEIKKRLPFESAAEEAYLNLARTYAQLSGPSETLFKRHGISPAKYNILRILRGEASGGDGNGDCGKYGLPSLEIAERMITRVPDITRLVDGLEKTGLVHRTRCKEDRRVVYVGITRKGHDLLDRLDKPVHELVHQLMAHMSETDLGEMNRLLVKARKAE
jgi:DNA-binding MarR family transcriptional regulator